MKRYAKKARPLWGSRSVRPANEMLFTNGYPKCRQSHWASLQAMTARIRRKAGVQIRAWHNRVKPITLPARFLKPRSEG